MITSDMVWRAEREIAAGATRGFELAWLGERLEEIERRKPGSGMAEERRLAGVSEELANRALDAFRAH